MLSYSEVKGVTVEGLYKKIGHEKIQVEIERHDEELLGYGFKIYFDVIVEKQNNEYAMFIEGNKYYGQGRAKVYIGDGSVEVKKILESILSGEYIFQDIVSIV